MENTLTDGGRQERSGEPGVVSVVDDVVDGLAHKILWLILEKVSYIVRHVFRLALRIDDEEESV